MLIKAELAHIFGTIILYLYLYFIYYLYHIIY